MASLQAFLTFFGISFWVFFEFFLHLFDMFGAFFESCCTFRGKFEEFRRCLGDWKKWRKFNKSEKTNEQTQNTSFDLFLNPMFELTKSFCFLFIWLDFDQILGFQTYPGGHICSFWRGIRIWGQKRPNFGAGGEKIGKTIFR